MNNSALITFCKLNKRSIKKYLI